MLLSLAALLALLLVLLLPLLVGAAWLHSEAREERAPWWHAMAADRSASGAAAEQTGVAKVEACSQCGAAEPPHRCTGCRKTAYCSRTCQQAHWVQGHKHSCKKLRKAQLSAVKLGSTARAAHGSASAAAADGSGGGSQQESPAESNSTPPLPRRLLYPAERYAELAAAPPQRKQPLGLQNVGNSCYANSLLQALLATPALAAYLVSGEHGRGCVKPSSSDWCALCELETLAAAAYDGGGSTRVLNPRPLLRNVKRLGKQFSFGRQEDSHELFIRLTEAIEAVQLLEAGGKARFDLRTRETLLVHHAFAGYTRNQVECLSCGHVSRTYECCTSLTLEVGPRVTSLEAALARFAAAERLDGDNRYKCDGCRSYVAADKSTRLEAAAHCLQICLKRFAPGRFGKITTKLSFPEELDLRPYMAAGCQDAAPAEYRLYGVVVHIDWGRSTDYGHYVAYVRCGSQWFLCDDSSVTPVAAARVLSQGAYLLFYERAAPRQMTLAADDSTSAAAAGVAAECVPAGGDAGAAAAADGMPRVETAPASLPHLRTPGAAATAASSASELSPESSADVALTEEPRQEGGIEVGTPERLHISASDSDLSAARDRSAAAAAAQQQQGSAQQPAAAQQAAALEQQPGGASSLQADRLHAHVAAAAAARAEMQALLAEQAGGSAGPGSEAGDADGSPLSQQSSGSHFGPTSNPFGLLGGEEGEEAEEAEESNSASRGSGAGGGGSEEQGGESAADQPEQQQQQQQHPSSDGDLAAKAAVAAAGGAPAGAAAAAGVSCTAAAEGQQEAAAEEPQAAPAGLALAELGLEERPLEDQAAMQDGSGGGSGAHSPCSASGSSGLDSGSEGGGPPRRTPKHRASVREEAASGRRVLRLSVDLPGVGEHEVDWHVAPHAGRQLLVLRAPPFALELPLPVRVAPQAEAAAQWAAPRQKLTLTLPVTS